MEWLRKLRKMPMYSVLLMALAAVILGVGIGYHTYATFSTIRLQANGTSWSHGNIYEWHGERLLLQQDTGTRTGSTCMIERRDGVKQSVYVPLNSSKGMFNTPDYAEVAPQPGITATITCSHEVKLTVGESAVERARTVNSYFFKAGIPALAAIPVLAAVGIPLLRSRSGKSAA